MNQRDQINSMLSGDIAHKMSFRMTQEAQDRVLQSLQNPKFKASRLRGQSRRILLNLGSVIAAVVLVIGVIAAISHEGYHRVMATLIHDGPRVVIYHPFQGGAAPMKPELDVYVDLPKHPTIQQQSQGLFTKQLVAYVTLSANQQSATFAPITLTIKGEGGNPYSKHYTVTKKDLHFSKDHGHQYKVKMAVPPRSGPYVVEASDAQFKARANTVLVDYGGYYKVGEVPLNIHTQVGTVSLTLTKVIMTHDRTRILFTGTGKQLNDITLEGTKAHEILSLNGKSSRKTLSSLGMQVGPMAQVRQGEFDFYPVTTHTQQIRFTVMIPTAPFGQTHKPVSFTIPLSN